MPNIRDKHKIIIIDKSKTIYQKVFLKSEVEKTIESALKLLRGFYRIYY